jgi:hypothetical protein
MALGILLILGGIGLLAAYFLLPGALFGAGLGGIGALLAPFGLILLGIILVWGSAADKGKS